MQTPVARPLSSFKVLVIDDQQQMRQIIRESLYRLGIRNVVMTGNAREALKAMHVENVDVVLSDYNLGEGTDGQQLLEVARSTNVLNPTAPWIFITANSLRNDVLAAGDFTPDGYIVKPFTDQLLCRYIETLSARKAMLAPLLHAIDAKKWNEVLAVAAGFIARGDSLSIEGMKQKANAFMKLGRFEEANAAYNAVLQLNSELPWARLGSANALRAMGRVDEARRAFEALIATHPDYASAYDALLEIAEEQGDQDAALATARAVADLVPNARRKFRLGAVALDAGKADVAVKALEHAVAKNKGSVTRSHQENVLLAQALLDNGDPKKALAVATDAAKQYPDHPGAQVLSKAVCAQVHQCTGNTEEATKLMAEVERELVSASLADSNKLLIAKSALATGRLELGQGLIEAVARNNTDKPLMLNAALRAAQGTAVEGACQDIVARAGAEVQQALQDLQLAKRNADFIRAIDIGETALAVSPANFHIQIELCTLYLVAMGRACGKPEHATRAEDLLTALDRKHPNHTRVAAARKFYRERLASPVTAL
ncbi:MAG: response regulator [Burkholderiales bacterium]|jgi:CheY-like chemotaxis protein|nr:response regulator [Burkholderiales bacterium]